MTMEMYRTEANRKVGAAPSARASDLGRGAPYVDRIPVSQISPLVIIFAYLCEYGAVCTVGEASLHRPLPYIWCPRLH